MDAFSYHLYDLKLITEYFIDMAKFIPLNIHSIFQDSVFITKVS